jgi:hypothetical protein
MMKVTQLLLTLLLIASLGVWVPSHAQNSSNRAVVWAREVYRLIQAASSSMMTSPGSWFFFSFFPFSLLLFCLCLCLSLSL